MNYHCPNCKKDVDPAEFMGCMVIHPPGYKCPRTEFKCPECGEYQRAYPKKESAPQ